MRRGVASARAPRKCRRKRSPFPANTGGWAAQADVEGRHPRGRRHARIPDNAGRDGIREGVNEFSTAPPGERPVRCRVRRAVRREQALRRVVGPRVVGENRGGIKHACPMPVPFSSSRISANMAGRMLCEDVLVGIIKTFSKRLSNKFGRRIGRQPLDQLGNSSIATFYALIGCRPENQGSFDQVDGDVLPSIYKFTPRLDSIVIQHVMADGIRIRRIRTIFFTPAETISQHLRNGSIVMKINVVTGNIRVRYAGNGDIGGVNPTMGTLQMRSTSFHGITFMITSTLGEEKGTGMFNFGTIYTTREI
jgi:hypothetical protein